LSLEWQVYIQFFDKLADKKGTIEPPFTIIPEIEGGALLIITAAVKEHREALYNLLTKAETKKTFLKVADGSYDTPNLFTSNTLGRQSFKRNKLEKLHQKLQSEVKMEKVTKLEELLEEEIKQRKVLEKNMQKLEESFRVRMDNLEAIFEDKLREQREKNTKNEKRLSELEKQLHILTVTLSSFSEDEDSTDLKHHSSEEKNKSSLSSKDKHKAH